MQLNKHNHLSDSSEMHFHIAYFITPHGFGHASRAAAVMNALSVYNPTIHFEVITEVPKWFFNSSLDRPFSYHPLLCDIGLIQNSPMQEDLKTTLIRLNSFLPFDQKLVNNLARFINEERHCQMVLCDIAPLGIAVASAAGLPSFLIENFTWDWIYQGYLDHEDGFSKFIPLFNDYFSSADHHIQVNPVCTPAPDTELTAQPVSRKPLTSRMQTRNELGIPHSSQAVLITMGGIRAEYDFLNQLLHHPNVYFIIPGSSEKMQTKDNLVLLPHHSKFFHPDLIRASDSVIGKVGYSTVAEVYHAGIPYGCIPRPQFRESDVLISFIMDNNPCKYISPEEFASGRWIKHLPELLEMSPVITKGENGADQVASFLSKYINHQGINP